MYLLFFDCHFILHFKLSFYSSYVSFTLCIWVLFISQSLHNCPLPLNLSPPIKQSLREKRKKGGKFLKISSWTCSMTQGVTQ